MKRFYKIFMAVAAVAGVTACTTDVTEDLGVNLNGGPTTLTLSLDDTRTQLGDPDKDGDGKVTSYPLTWAAGDAISVNGSVSNPLTADEAGDKTATFTFKDSFGENPKSYFIAYPATSTKNQVVFAAEQTHVDNTTFGNGAAVMYGYATDLNNVTLNHLTGILKIGIVSGITNPAYIKEVRISTVDRKPIAGAFNVDAEGKLTATENATEVITYSFNGSSALTAEPTYIHVAVPAGVYDELYVTLVVDERVDNTETAERVMYKTITTDSTKPIKAGTVREFSNNIEFVPTDETETYVIANYYDLLDFQQAINNAQATMDNAEATEDAKTAAAATLAKSAVLVNDIEIPTAVQPGYEWAPINAANYTGTITGNGYAIKNLTTPLFVKTAASFKGLHLDVAIAETVNPNVGAFARQLVANGNTPSITHCTVSGSIEVNTALKAEYFEGKDANTTISMGGLVGLATGVTFSNCVNSASLTFTDVLADGVSGTSYFGNVGGIVGAMATVDNIEPSFTNCVNKEEITYNDSSNVKAAIGGVIGNIPEEYASSVTLDNCSNSGDIKVGGTVYHCYVGGTIGSSYPAALKLNNSTLKNTGAITISATVTNSSNQQYFAVGGIIGRQYISSVTNGKVINRCDIKFIGKTSTHMFIGGIYGLHRIQIDSSVNYINTGDVIAATSFANNTTKGYRIGGFIAYSKESRKLSNVQVYCNIATLLEDANGYYSHDPADTRLMGILDGFSEVKTLSNIKVGGSVITKATVAADGTITPVTTKVLGTDLELYEYIYGKRGLISTLPTGVDLLESAPTVE